MSRDRETGTEAGVNADAEAGDDFHAEVSDLRPKSTTTAPPSAAPRSPLASRRTLRQRLTGLTITLCLLALTVGMLWRASAGLRPSGPPAQATATAAPDNTNLFYLPPNPPGVIVSLDGYGMAVLPTPGDPHPLRLSPGPHRFVWHSQVLPLQQLECTVSVPASAQDTCPFVPLHALPVTMRGLPGKVIGLHVSLDTLKSSAASSLGQAIVQTLASPVATATVQPGEIYYGEGSPSAAPGPIVAHQPLRAMLTYETVPAAGYPEPCILAVDQIPCRFPGQDCEQLCTVAGTPLRPPPASDAPATATEWDAAILVHAVWRYTTLDGFNVTTSAESFGMQLLALRIIWDGATWHVTPLFGHVPGFDVADDPVCDPARYWLSQTTWSFMLGENPPPGSQVQFASDANPADGCVAALTHGQPAIFLERFGLLLTVNENACNPTDNLPVADASEQALASQLLAQLQPS